MRILIKNGLILTLDEEDHIRVGQNILIEDGLIAQIGEGVSQEDNSPINQVIDASEKLVMPGLVNAHFHSYDAYMKGLYEDLPLEIWFPYVNLAHRRPLTQHEIYVRTLRVATEMLRNGITTAHDNVTLAPLNEESMDAVMTAYRDSGIRAVVGATMVNKPPSAALPYLDELLPPDVRAEFDSATMPRDSDLQDLAGSTIRKWHLQDDRLHVALAPSAPQRCTDEFMLSMNELSQEQNVPWSTHVLETKVQAVTGAQLYGHSIVEHLAELGLLTSRLAVHHGVWVSDHDIELLAEGGTSVTHNPISNLKLGSGIAPVPAMLQAGVNVALGCDNNSANDAQNLFEAMKFAALLPAVAGPEFGSWNGSREAFRMATTAGARSMLLQDKIGTLEVGKRADLVLLDLNTHAFTPLNDPVRQLVYSECGSSVDTVLVNGTVVMENRELLTVDEADLLEEARAIGLSDTQGHDRASQAAAKLRPYLERMYSLCTKQDVGIRRYTGIGAR